MAVTDRPWRRPGAATYARARLRNALRPPIEVYRMPGTVRKDADRKSTRLNSSHIATSRMPSSA